MPKNMTRVKLALEEARLLIQSHSSSLKPFYTYSKPAHRFPCQKAYCFWVEIESHLDFSSFRQRKYSRVNKWVTVKCGKRRQHETGAEEAAYGKRTHETDTNTPSHCSKKVQLTVSVLDHSETLIQKPRLKHVNNSEHYSSVRVYIAPESEGESVSNARLRIIMCSKH